MPVRGLLVGVGDFKEQPFGERGAEELFSFNKFY